MAGRLTAVIGGIPRNGAVEKKIACLEIGIKFTGLPAVRDLSISINA
jgi:hypothetical protein